MSVPCDVCGREIIPGQRVLTNRMMDEDGALGRQGYQHSICFETPGE